MTTNLGMTTNRPQTRSRCIGLAAALGGLGCLAFVVAGLAVAASGDFDGSFSGNGIAKTGFGPSGHGLGFANAVAVQPNDRIVIAGGTKSGDFGLARFRRSGKLDRSFGDGGTVRIDFGEPSERADDVAVQRDGRIVVVGGALAGDRTVIGIARLRPSGELDPSFGTGGKAIVDPFEPSTETWRELTLAFGRSGEIVVGGTASVSGPVNSPGFVAQLEADGDLDRSFADGGLKTIDLAPEAMGAGSTYLNEVITDRRGRIAAAVTTIDLRDERSIRAVMVRLRSNGDYDPSFSGNGWKRVLPGWSGLSSIATAPHGRLVAAGGTYNRVLVARVKGSGAFDRSFAGDGVKKTGLNMGDAKVAAHRMMLQRNGKPLLVGRWQAGYRGGDVVARVRWNGNLDRSFSGDGKRVLRYRAAFTDAVMQANGRILLTGVAGRDSSRAFVARLRNRERPFVAP